MLPDGWSTAVGVGLALGSSLLLAVGGWLQWRGLQDQSEGHVSPLRLARSPFWAGGLLASGLGTVAYHGALLLARLTLVQPLSSLHVAFTALLAWKGRRVRYREWLALALCLGGTACLALVETRAGPAPAPCWPALALLVGIGALPLLSPSPVRLASSWPALRAGLCYGLSAILWKAGMGLPPFSAGWCLLLGLFAAGFLGGFAFLQVAFRRLDAGTANALAACIAALFPLPAGRWVFGEDPSLLSLAAALAAVAGVFLLGTAARPLKEPGSLPTP